MQPEYAIVVSSDFWGTADYCPPEVGYVMGSSSISSISISISKRSHFGEIDFASRFPPRQLEAKILELAIGTIKIESGACDLPRGGGRRKRVVDKFAI